MRLGLDLDSTITAAPKMFKALAEAVRADKGTVHVITGHDDNEGPITPKHYQDVKEILDNLGVPYDIIYIAPEPLPANKAAYCKKVGIDFFIDDNKKNVKAVRKVTNAARFFAQ